MHILDPQTQLTGEPQAILVEAAAHDCLAASVDIH
jgi:hypothetical protein